MRLQAVILPELGTGPKVSIVVSHWYSAQGKRVCEGDRLVEVLVGPALVDVAVPVTGRLVQIRRREYDAVAPGDVLGMVAVRDPDRRRAGEGETPPP